MVSICHVSGECDCTEGYTGEDCSFSVTAAPLVDELTNLGLCDMASSDCETFSVYGDNFADSADLKCSYQEAQVSGCLKQTYSLIIFIVKSISFLTSRCTNVFFSKILRIYFDC